MFFRYLKIVIIFDSGGVKLSDADNENSIGHLYDTGCYQKTGNSNLGKMTMSFIIIPDISLDHTVFNMYKVSKFKNKNSGFFKYNDQLIILVAL